MSSRYRLRCPSHAKLAVRLRIPAWVQQPSIHVNGKRVTTPILAGGFVTLRREWRTGDRIDLELPRRTELRAVDAHHPNTVALVCGPLLLFGVTDEARKVTRAQLLAAQQQSASSPEWRAATAIGTLRLVPFWVIKDATYFTYLSV
jgi:DUF1680 family protein